MQDMRAVQTLPPGGALVFRADQCFSAVISWHGYADASIMDDDNTQSPCYQVQGLGWPTGLAGQC